MDGAFLVEETTKAELTGEDIIGAAATAQIVGADGITYRFVQFAQDGAQLTTEGVQLVGTTTCNGGVSVQQQQNGDAQATTPTDAGGATPVTNATTVGGATAAATPFYVMMSATPTENVTLTAAPTQRIIMPGKPAGILNARINKTIRDDRRRATHNEVERRRRDKINLWIMKLAKIIPDCHQQAHSDASGSLSATEAPKIIAHNSSAQSKGIILSKACDYITELKQKADKVDQQLFKENARLESLVQNYRQKYEAAAQENHILKDALAQAGIHINIMEAEPETTVDDPSNNYDECIAAIVE